jgi:hypothetical protein
MPRLRTNLRDWFSRDKVLENEKEIVNFIQDPDSDLDELKYNEEPAIYWAAEPKFRAIFIEILKRPETSEIIDHIYDKGDKYHTVLSYCAYHGFTQITELLLLTKAAIEVKHGGGKWISAYKELVNGYQQRPAETKDYTEDYKKIFRDLLTADPRKPKRKFFSDRYHVTQEKAYLICIKFYDELQSKTEDESNALYKNRDILTVENDAVQIFFRCQYKLKKDGSAKGLKENLFSNVYTDVTGLPSRSIIITLVDKMRRTDEDVVEKATVGDIWHKSRILFSAKFKLGSTTTTQQPTQFIYEWRPCKWQRGNCTFKVGGNNLVSFGHGLAAALEKITCTVARNGLKTNARTKMLGELFLKKTKKLCSFKCDEFTYFESSKRLKIRLCDSDKDHPVATLVQAQEMIHKLNGLLILWSIVEPARRLSGHQADDATDKAIKIDHIPVATMQMRALQLLKNGIISIQDIFGSSEEYRSVNYRYTGDHHHAKYGVSTGTNVVHYVDIVEAKARRLVELDLPLDALAAESTASFFSRNYTKQLLKDGYGSGKESSNGDYSDSELSTSKFA